VRWRDAPGIHGRSEDLTSGRIDGSPSHCGNDPDRTWRGLRPAVGILHPAARDRERGAPATGGLTGHVVVTGGPHEGEYQLAAGSVSINAIPGFEADNAVCVAGPDSWTVAFAGGVLTESITTLQLAGTSRDSGAPLADFFMTIGATTDPNTVRISPSQEGGTGTTVYRLEGNVAHVEMTGTSADGVTVTLEMSCSPVEIRP